MQHDMDYGDEPTIRHVVRAVNLPLREIKVLGRVEEN